MSLKDESRRLSAIMDIVGYTANKNPGTRVATFSENERDSVKVLSRLDSFPRSASI
jgi:hypothetical protein